MKNKNIKKYAFLAILLLTVVFMGTATIWIINTAAEKPLDKISGRFDKLSRSDKLQAVLALRNKAILEARENGEYRCCIDPPCTMCYTEANKWNNFTPGTCACDDLIARGEEACPQCQRGIEDIHDEENTLCDINATTPTCESSIK